jgi:hypothetical protein
MADGGQGEGLSTVAMLKKMEAWNLQLVDEAKIRHEMNNRLHRIFGDTVHEVSESNRQLAASLTRHTQLEHDFVRVKHAMFGPLGDNGVVGSLKVLREDRDRDRLTIQSIQRRQDIWWGGIMVLQAAIGIGLAIWLR